MNSPIPDTAAQLRNLIERYAGAREAAGSASAAGLFDLDFIEAKKQRAADLKQQAHDLIDRLAAAPSMLPPSHTPIQCGLSHATATGGST